MRWSAGSLTIHDMPRSTETQNQELMFRLTPLELDAFFACRTIEEPIIISAIERLTIPEIFDQEFQTFAGLGSRGSYVPHTEMYISLRHVFDIYTKERAADALAAQFAYRYLALIGKLLAEATLLQFSNEQLTLVSILFIKSERLLTRLVNNDAENTSMSVLIDDLDKNLCRLSALLENPA